MESKGLNQPKAQILAISLVILAVCSVLLWQNYYTPLSDLSTSVAVPAPTHPIQSGEVIGDPLRIKIPSIAVNAIVEKVALAKDGSMAVPKQPLNTGWYELGPRPGETGSAVISGHLNWWYGATGSFANLRKLKPGDQITVQDANGALIPFVVSKTKTYGATADATDVFISNDGKAHLNLITCAGVWNKRAQQYTKRLVVFADKE